MESRPPKSFSWLNSFRARRDCRIKSYRNTAHYSIDFTENFPLFCRLLEARHRQNSDKYKTQLWSSKLNLSKIFELCTRGIFLAERSSCHNLEIQIKLREQWNSKNSCLLYQDCQPSFFVSDWLSDNFFRYLTSLRLNSKSEIWQENLKQLAELAQKYLSPQEFKTQRLTRNKERRLHRIDKADIEPVLVESFNHFGGFRGRFAIFWHVKTLIRLRLSLA